MESARKKTKEIVVSTAGVIEQPPRRSGALGAHLSLTGGGMLKAGNSLALGLSNNIANYLFHRARIVGLSAQFGVRPCTGREALRRPPCTSRPVTSRQAFYSTSLSNGRREAEKEIGRRAPPL